jgi:hypothetical protein
MTQDGEGIARFYDEALAVCAKIVAQCSLEMISSRKVHTSATLLQVQVLSTRSSRKNQSPAFV